MIYKYAYISNGKVTAIVEREEEQPDTERKFQLQPEEECFVGWAYTPNATPRFAPAPPINVWTAYQFLLRFTEAELLAIRAAAVTDPITWRFLTLATAAQEIIANDPQTIAGMDYLVSVNLLTEQRKAEILG
jgi:hypothetical protein